MSEVAKDTGGAKKAQGKKQGGDGGNNKPAADAKKAQNKKPVEQAAKPVDDKPAAASTPAEPEKIATPTEAASKPADAKKGGDGKKGGKKGGDPKKDAAPQGTTEQPAGSSAAPQDGDKPADNKKQRQNRKPAAKEGDAAAAAPSAKDGEGEGQAREPRKPRKPRDEESPDDWKERREKEIAAVVLAPGEVVEAPSKEKLQADLKIVDDQIAELRAQVAAIKETLDKQQESRKPQGPNKEKERFDETRKEFENLLEDLKPLFEKQKLLKAAREKARKDNDDLQQKMKEAGASDASKVDEKIKRLEYYLSTHSLSLNKEKALITEIKTLTASKKIFGEVDAIKARKEAAEKEFAACCEEINAKKASADAAKKVKDDAFAELNAKRDLGSDERSKTQALIDERKGLFDKIDAMFAQRKEVQNAHRKHEIRFFAYERKKREEERLKSKQDYEKRQAARVAKTLEIAQRKEEARIRRLQEGEERIEAEYAEKIANLDQLVAYLKRLAPSASASVAAPAAEPETPKEEAAPKADKPAAKDADKAAKDADKPAAKGGDKPAAKGGDKAAKGGDKAAKGGDKAAKGGKDQVKLVRIGKDVAGFDDDIFGTKVVKPKKQGKPKPKKSQSFMHDLAVMQELEKFGAGIPLTADEVAPAIEALTKKRAELQTEKVEKQKKCAEDLAKLEAEQAAAKEAPATTTEESAPAEADQAAPAVETN